MTDETQSEETEEASSSDAISAPGSSITPAPLEPAFWPQPPANESSVTQVESHTPRRRLIVAIMVAVLIVAVGGGIVIATRPHSQTSSVLRVTPSASPDSNTSAAAMLYRQALTTVRGEAGFHYVSASLSQTITGDAGKAGGQQVITVTSAYGLEDFTLILSGGMVYFQGNEPALEDQLGIPPASAATLGGKWISVAATDDPYQTLAAGIDISDQVSEMALQPTALSKVNDGGAAATRITGSVPPQFDAPGGTGYLDVARATHLPLRYVSTLSNAGANMTDTVSFSHWGSAPAVTVPPGSVAWSTLGATSPPGGYGSGGGGSGSGGNGNSISV